MEHVIVRYTVRPDKVEEVKDAISELVGAVRSEEPGLMSYEAFQVEGSGSFVHIMTFRNADAVEIHRDTPHVTKFMDTLYKCCETEPQFTRLDMIRSSRF